MSGSAGSPPRQQPDADGAQQGERVQVDLAAAHAPVQARGGGAAEVPGTEGADRRAAGDRLPGRHPRVDRLLRAPRPPGGAAASAVARSPPGWSMPAAGRPATMPANTTTPSRAASTGAPGTAARSTP